MKPVKLGIIGCGIAAHELHWPALKRLKDKFEIVAVCNHTEKKAKEFAELVGNVPYSLDYKELLEMPEIEAVDIMLPIEMNYASVCDAMKSGKHILTEKPLASDLKQAVSLLSLEKSYAKAAMVAENFRFRKVFERIKAIIKEGTIGQTYSVIWNAFEFMHTERLYGNTKWRQNNKHTGGFITDGGVHYIAALRDIFGNLSNIGSFTHRVNSSIGTVDTFSFQFVTDENVKGLFNLYFSAKGFSENRLTVFGNEGTIIVENELLTVKNAEKLSLSEKFENDDGYKAEFEEFYECIRAGKPVKSTFFEAYADMKTIIDAISASVT